ncbi:MAG: prefoldin subunit beta [Candidatus Thermoplasmatota archaeon]|nr:prefoldin subunit beta [Candidatus Thermoplasmatota archaeon]
MDIHPETEKQLAEFEHLRAQYQSIATHLMQFKQVFRETTRAIEEMETLKSDAKVYKEVGSLLIEVDDKTKLKEELNEKKETMEIRLKALQSQETELKEHLTKMQADLELALKKEN